ncbi:hypothetical protein H6802_03205 [Candidatus Nomurabacteria bacterium]|nr:hypothetical protein [Candidatus Nomurabacteria bacterium]MCB9827081.1 hypothetical protein [Candidatus Nomurabacteria bacterium]MCB9827877.1 hypothetical protein [Candidatus Nomurabacteria bacterium]
MLTPEQIRKNLLRDASWVPAEDASDMDWELYQRVYDDMIESGELDEPDDDMDEGLYSDDDDY